MRKRTKFGTVALLSLLTLTVCYKRKKVYNEYVTNEAPEPKECTEAPKPPKSPVATPAPKASECTVDERNMLCNGSFENSYYNGTDYAVLADGELECWKAEDGIEVQGSGYVAQAVDGDYVVELDTTRKNVQICQTVDVEAGKSYRLTLSVSQKIWVMHLQKQNQ